MSMDIHFFKNDVNFRKIRKDIDTLQETLRSIQDKIEQLKMIMKMPKVSAFNINAITIPQTFFEAKRCQIWQNDYLCLCKPFVTLMW